jgi:hypothetical protein
MSSRSVRDESTWDVTHLYIEAMLGIFLNSYPYLNQQKHFVFLIIAFTFSSTKLEIRAEWILPGSKGVGMRGKGLGVGGEMAQTIYAHMNKQIKKKKKKGCHHFTSLKITKRIFLLF